MEQELELTQEVVGPEAELVQVVVGRWLVVEMLEHMDHTHSLSLLQEQQPLHKNQELPQLRQTASLDSRTF